MKLISKHKIIVDEIGENLKKFNFYLGGGSAIMYYFDYRSSEDLDFFTEKEINLEKIHFPNTFKVILHQKDKKLLKYANGVNISFICYNYKLINTLNKIDNIFIASPEDLAFMKFLAILDKGRKKDFIDFYFLVKYLNLTPVFFIEHFNNRYGNFIPPIITMSINYFEKADKEQDLYTKENVSWEKIKNFYRSFWKL
ncbi:MAG: nucleotidyl transferase AbiEii/AbiGii toxin family protein [Bacteroidales bacterium]|nr:nucleotidyl transferase AbiEii/AbiGii toxin family protein [Bacteroidales bacterium]